MFTPPPKKNLRTDPFDTTLVFGHFKAAGKPIKIPDFFFFTLTEACGATNYVSLTTREQQESIN